MATEGGAGLSPGCSANADGHSPANDDATAEQPATDPRTTVALVGDEQAVSSNTNAPLGELAPLKSSAEPSSPLLTPDTMHAFRSALATFRSEAALRELHFESLVDELNGEAELRSAELDLARAAADEASARAAALEDELAQEQRLVTRLQGRLELANTDAAADANRHRAQCAELKATLAARDAVIRGYEVELRERASAQRGRGDADGAVREEAQRIAKQMLAHEKSMAAFRDRDVVEQQHAAALLLVTTAALESRELLADAMLDGHLDFVLACRISCVGLDAASGVIVTITRGSPRASPRPSPRHKTTAEGKPSAAHLDGSAVGHVDSFFGTLHVTSSAVGCTSDESSDDANPSARAVAPHARKRRGRPQAVTAEWVEEGEDWTASDREPGPPARHAMNPALDMTGPGSPPTVEVGSRVLGHRSGNQADGLAAPAGGGAPSSTPTPRGRSSGTPLDPDIELDGSPAPSGSLDPAGAVVTSDGDDEAEDELAFNGSVSLNETARSLLAASGYDISSPKRAPSAVRIRLPGTEHAVHTHNDDDDN
jgi:hypothetical protein